MRQGKTGMASTDVQRNWNSGVKKNVGLKKVKHINFNHHRPSHIYPGPSLRSMQELTSPQLFKNHGEFIDHSNSSVMAPLFKLQTNGLLQLSYRADVDTSQAGLRKHDPAHNNTLCHTEHSTTLTCPKCTKFYEDCIKVSHVQADTLMEETRMQSSSQLWHDARKLRITASTAKKVPKRSTTDPRKFLKEHLYPTFTGNTATQHGKENEIKVITLMESRGHTVEKRGLVVHPDYPWLGASPDGILDSTQLLEIKCPFQSCMSLTEFLGRPNGDIKRLGDEQYLILPKGKNGYYLQVNKMFSSRLALLLAKQCFFISISMFVFFTNMH